MSKRHRLQTAVIPQAVRATFRVTFGICDVEDPMAELREDRQPASWLNDVWAMHFLRDQLFDGVRSAFWRSSRPSACSRRRWIHGSL